MSLVVSLKSKVEEISCLNSSLDTYPADRILDMATKIFGLISQDKKIAFVGNGGSAAEALHIAAEFTGKCVLDHPPFPVLCLNESQSAMSAIANDYGVKFMFSRLVQAHLRPGDLLICLSTSGKSENVIEAMQVAMSAGIQVCLWTGDYELDFPGVDIWKVPSRSTPRVQEVHLVWGHLISELVELLWENN